MKSLKNMPESLEAITDSARLRPLLWSLGRCFDLCFGKHKRVFSLVEKCRVLTQKVDPSWPYSAIKFPTSLVKTACQIRHYPLANPRLGIPGFCALSSRERLERMALCAFLRSTLYFVRLLFCAVAVRGRGLCGSGCEYFLTNRSMLLMAFARRNLTKCVHVSKICWKDRAVYSLIPVLR